MEDCERYPEDDPWHHTTKIKGMLSDAMNHAREEAGKIQALFGTTAEVLGGLIKEFTAGAGPGSQAP